MKKHDRKKLTLDTTTLRTLSDAHLIGGALAKFTAGTVCTGPTCSFCTLICG